MQLHKVDAVPTQFASIFSSTSLFGCHSEGNEVEGRFERMFPVRSAGAEASVWTAFFRNEGSEHPVEGEQ